MSITNEQRQKIGSLIAKKRDLRSELFKTENEIDAEILQLIGAPFTKNHKNISEAVFSTLSYQPKTSDKMGKYEVAEQEKNDPQKFAEALDLLEAHNATIQKRFHPVGYVFAYWIFRGLIYRAKLKK